MSLHNNFFKKHITYQVTETIFWHFLTPLPAKPTILLLAFNIVKYSCIQYCIYFMSWTCLHEEPVLNKQWVVQEISRVSP